MGVLWVNSKTNSSTTVSAAIVRSMGVSPRPRERTPSPAHMADHCVRHHGGHCCCRALLSELGGNVLLPHGIEIGRGCYWRGREGTAGGRQGEQRAGGDKGGFLHVLWGSQQVGGPAQVGLPDRHMNASGPSVAHLEALR